MAAADDISEVMVFATKEDAATLQHTLIHTGQMGTKMFIYSADFSPISNSVDS